jgi:hypothetical protein
MARLARAAVATEYERLVAERGEVCAICGARPKTRKLHVDHDHRTGEVRGLLCFRCNRALPAYLGADWLRKAADYVSGGCDTNPIRDWD